MSGPTLSVDRSATGRFHDHFGNLNGRWTWDDAKDVLLYGCGPVFQGLPACFEMF